MGELRWYKRDPRAALIGMSNLTLEETGAYNKVLDLIYINDGALDDNPRYIAGVLGCDIRIWKRIRIALIEKEKLYLCSGKLRNERADKEVDVALARVVAAAYAGVSSASKRAATLNVLKGLPSTPVQRPFNVLTPTKK